MLAGGIEFHDVFCGAAGLAEVVNAGALSAAEFHESVFPDPWPFPEWSGVLEAAVLPEAVG